MEAERRVGCRLCVTSESLTCQKNKNKNGQGTYDRNQLVERLPSEHSILDLIFSIMYNWTWSTFLSIRDG